MYGSTGLGSGGVPNHANPVVFETFAFDSLGRTHEEKYQFLGGAVVNQPTVATSWTGGSPHRAGLSYHDNLPSGLSVLSAPVGLEFGYDNIGRLSSMDWNAAPSVSGMTALADYGWVGGLRQRRTVQYDSHSSVGSKGQSDFTYDAYHRLTKIEDTVWTDASTSYSASKFEYEYDEVHNLLKEQYTKVDGSVGDRFAYDEFHRLSKAWMGVDSTTMAGGDPTGWASSGMHEYLTYGLDGVNNRTTAERYTSSTPLVETYTLQGSGHPQGPSNRYAAVAGFGLSSAASYTYDDRGNLKYDGRFLYRYDYLNRLQEVWRVKLVEEEEEEGERLLVVEREALDEACTEVQQSVPDLLSRLPREHTDPTFRSRLKARLRGGVIRLMPEGARRAGGCWSAGTLVDDADVDLVAVYGYDHWNRRTVTVVVEPGLADTGFHVFDGWRQVAQHTLHVSGSSFYAVPTKQFVWDARLDEMLAYRRRVVVSSVVSWEVYYVLHGGQDTAAKLVDAAGVVREQYEYDPYGMVKVYSGAGSYLGGTSPLGLAFLWKAVRLDAETGLLYMRNRYYSTGLGRFLTRDPIGVWGDAEALGNEACYGWSSPLSVGDPLGLQGSANRDAIFKELHKLDRMSMEIHMQRAALKKMAEIPRDFERICKNADPNSNPVRGAEIADLNKASLGAGQAAKWSLIVGPLKGLLAKLPRTLLEAKDAYESCELAWDSTSHADRLKKAYDLLNELREEDDALREKLDDIQEIRREKWAELTGYWIKEVKEPLGDL